MRKGLRAAIVALIAMSVAMAAAALATNSLASGGWTIFSSPNVGSTNQINGVTCFSSTDCVAVGAYTNSRASADQTLIEEDTGSGWTVVSSPNASSDDQLSSVACASASDCTAVGWYYDSDGVVQTLIEENTGSGWAIVSSPNVSDTDTYLEGVTCVGSTECIAVGLGEGPLIEENTGSGWTIVSSPVVEGEFKSVTCASSTDCIAVGFYEDSDFVAQTLIEENTGSGWAVVSSPNVTGYSASLSSVTCASSTDCLAVGYYYDPSGSFGQTLIEENTGTGWSISSSPNIAGSFNYLAGVSCLSGTDCIAVGYYGIHGDAQTLIEENTGSGWSVDSSLDTSSGDQFNSGTCASSTVCFAAGSSEDENDGSVQTLIEERGLATPATTSTPAVGAILIGGSDQDSAIVSGDAADGSPTGSIAFYLCGPLSGAQGCSSTEGTAVGSPVALTAGSNDTATATSPSVTPSATGTWCFAAEYSGGGNYVSSADSSADECFTVVAPTTVQDTDPLVAYDNWLGVDDSTATDGSYRVDAHKGATATLKFSGTGITWVTHKGPDQGMASVSIDGKSKGTVDLYDASAQSYSKSYSGLKSSSHTIVIKVTGTKDSHSSATNVAFDAFVVGFTTIDDSSPKVQLDSWKGMTSSSASGGSYRISATSGATCGVTFTGARVDWITATGPSAGKATVTIDGVNKGTIDLYAPTVHWQVVETFSGLSPGTHSIVVKVLGTKNPKANSASVIVDAFVLYSP